MNYATPEVIDTLKSTVPWYRDAVPECSEIQPIARIVHAGQDSVEFRAEDGANEGFAFRFALPVEEAAVLYPEFACCPPHHEAAVRRVRRVMAAAFN